MTDVDSTVKGQVSPCVQGESTRFYCLGAVPPAGCNSVEKRMSLGYLLIISRVDNGHKSIASAFEVILIANA